jgi:hypothetical protein
MSLNDGYIVGDVGHVLHMAYWVCLGIAPLILTLDTVWSFVVGITQCLMYSWVNSPLYPLNRRVARLVQENECISPPINIIYKVPEFLICRL